MLCAAQKDQVYAADLGEQSIDGLGEAAPQDPTSYVREWSTDTIEFPSAVAKLQGHPQRLRIDTVAALPNAPIEVREPRLAKLLRGSHCARTVKLNEIVELIGVGMADCNETAS